MKTTFIEDGFIEQFITDHLVTQDELEREAHESSGKLTASMLGNPVQWQILKIIGVPDLPADGYALRKFQRGRDVEDKFVNWLKLTGSLVDTQKEVSYRDTIGLIDALVDSSKNNWFSCGVIPHEVKSITNANFKWINKRGEPNEGHVLQATLYALAEGVDKFAIDYIASDDYRVKTFLIPTDYMAGEVESIITRFQETLDLGILPVFESRYESQKNPTYAKYHEWMLLDADECEQKLKKEYPEAYKKLKGGE